MALHVGVARVTLRLPASHSLKEKRMVVRSVTERLRNRFNAAVAEVDTQDIHQVATIGVACISSDARHAREQLDKMVDQVERERLDLEVVDVLTEVVPIS